MKDQHEISTRRLCQNLFKSKDMTLKIYLIILLKKTIFDNNIILSSKLIPYISKK